MLPLPFRRSLLCLSVLAVLAAGVAAPAWAQEPPRRDRDAARAEPPPRETGSREARPGDRQRSQDALADSVRRFERNNRDSRVLSAERMQSDGRDVNRIKAMDDRGRVRVYVDDPQRGAQPPRRERTRGDDD